MMTWATDRPTEQGWYCWRRSTGDAWSTRPGQYNISYNGGRLCFGSGIPIDAEAGEWAGPIPEPTDAEEALCRQDESSMR